MLLIIILKAGTVFHSPVSKELDDKKEETSMLVRYQTLANDDNYTQPDKSNFHLWHIINNLLVLRLHHLSVRKFQDPLGLPHSHSLMVWLIIFHVFGC